MKLNKKQLAYLNSHNINPNNFKHFEDAALQILNNHAHSKQGQCLSTKYINSRSKYTWKCLKGHTFSNSWNNIISKSQWCPFCLGKHKTIEDLKAFAESKNGKCLSAEYFNEKHKYKWQCELGHSWEAVSSNVLQGTWCPTCSNKLPPNKDEIENLITEKEGVLVDLDYINNRSKIALKCKQNHTFSITWKDLRRGNWCKKCSLQGISKLEKTLKNLVIDMVGDIKLEQNKRFDFLRGFNSQKPLEIDLYYPDYKLGIELHGRYWHSEAVIKDPKRLKNLAQFKYKKCKEKGIKLIQIYDDELLGKSEQLKSIIQNAFGRIKEKIYAKNCIVKVLDSNSRVEFFNHNHISGDVKAKASFGLYDNTGRLVSALSIRTPFTKNKKGVIEIARFASKLNTVVVGGFQKLLKSVIQYSKTEGFTSILTYADCRFGTGNVYRISGFKHLRLNPPNYAYVAIKERNKVYSRFSCRKQSELSELDQNKLLNRYRIYDAGSEVYIRVL